MRCLRRPRITIGADQSPTRQEWKIATLTGWGEYGARSYRSSMYRARKFDSPEGFAGQVTPMERDPASVSSVRRKPRSSDHPDPPIPPNLPLHSSTLQPSFSPRRFPSIESSRAHRTYTGCLVKYEEIHRHRCVKFSCAGPATIPVSTDTQNRFLATRGLVGNEPDSGEIVGNIMRALLR